MTDHVLAGFPTFFRNFSREGVFPYAMKLMVKGWVGKSMFCMVGMAAMFGGAGVLTADVAATPYKGIAARNVFALITPPMRAPDPVVVKPAPPVADVTLNGIVAGFGMPTRAWIKMRASGSSGRGSMGEESFMLAEGQRAGDVTVLGINERSGVVKVMNSGLEQLLSLGK
jgi:hypothetical protein